MRRHPCRTHKESHRANVQSAVPRNALTRHTLCTDGKVYYIGSLFVLITSRRLLVKVIWATPLPLHYRRSFHHVVGSTHVLEVLHLDNFVHVHLVTEQTELPCL